MIQQAFNQLFCLQIGLSPHGFSGQSVSAGLAN